MPVKPIQLALNDQITSTSSTSPDTLFTSSDGVAQINSATVMNSSGSSVTITFQILASGGTPSASNHCWTQTIAANSTDIISGLIGKIIPNGGALYGYAGTTNVLYASVNGVSIV